MKCTSALLRLGNLDRGNGQLPVLAELGLTALEVMPVADFPAALAGATTVSILWPTRRYG